MVEATERKFDLAEIRNFWTEQAKQHGASSDASWSDQTAINMEIREIAQRLNDGDKVLDVGCANGFSTLNFALLKRLNIRGLDYIPEMITAAHESLKEVPAAVAKNVTFDVGDISSLAEPDNAFDKVVVIRVLINLVNWENQLKGLKECIRVLKPGGTLLISEATVQGWSRLNEMRREWNLQEIPMPSFNSYLDQDKFVEFAAAEGAVLKEIVNFSSTYFVVTRILKPLLLKALGEDLIKAADPTMHLNRWAGELPAGGDYGTQKLFVFQKKA